MSALVWGIKNGDLEQVKEAVESKVRVMLICEWRNAWCVLVGGCSCVVTFVSVDFIILTVGQWFHFFRDPVIVTQCLEVMIRSG